MPPLRYQSKLVISGNFAEHYQYNVPRFANTLSVLRNVDYMTRGSRGSGDDDSSVVDFKRRERDVRLCRTKIRRFVNSNPDMTKFLTLTFAEDVTDIVKANYQWKMFRQRLEYRLCKKLKYIIVPEIQQLRLERTGHGVWHFHSLLDIPYVQNDELASLWKNGFIRINRIDNVDNVGVYVSKYIGKEVMMVKGKRKFFHSLGLNKPIISIRDWYNEMLMSSDLFKNAEITFEKRFDSHGNSNVLYRHYLLNNNI